jgi:hypothetical protein
MKTNALLIAILLLGATVVSAEAKRIVDVDGDKNCHGCKIHQQRADTVKPIRCRSQLPCQRAERRSSWPGSMSDLPRSAPTAPGKRLTIAGRGTRARLLLRVIFDRSTMSA